MRLELVQLELGAGDRVAVRIDRRVAERLGDQLLELLGDDVLEHLGLGVDAIPRHAQRLGEEQLEQPVVADHLERDLAAVVGETHAAIGQVLDQPELAEALEHRRDRTGREAEPLGERVRRDGLVAARFECEDRLAVVLDGGRTRSFSSGHEQMLWYAKIFVKVLLDLHSTAL